MPAEPTLQVENLVKTFGRGNDRVSAVIDVSLTVDAGEFVAVRGPSGCGKTTLLLAAGTLLEPDAGEVRIAGQDPYSLGPDERAAFRAKTVGFVFQQFHLVPYLSVRDNILAPALAQAHAPSSRGDGRDAGARADELIELFGLEARSKHVPSKLSTGERQRTAMARALFSKPRLILADEPTGNLDHENALTVLGHLRAFVDEGGSVLLVTHDPVAASFAHRSIHLAKGREVPPPESSSEPSPPLGASAGSGARPTEARPSDGDGGR